MSEATKAVLLKDEFGTLMAQHFLAAQPNDTSVHVCGADAASAALLMTPPPPKGRQHASLLIASGRNAAAAAAVAAQALPRHRAGQIVRFAGVRPEDAAGLASVCKSVRSDGECLAWHLPKRGNEKAPPFAVPPLPNGLRLRPLRADVDAALVAARWPHGGADAPQYVAGLIESARCGGVAVVETASDRPVCWSLRYESGALGFLHTEPEYRRRGLAHAVLAAMLARVWDDPLPPFVFTVATNAPAIAFFRAHGFVEDGPLSWLSVEY